MDIEAIVEKHMDAWRVSPFVSPEDNIRAALTELSEAYAIEMRAYEDKVKELKQMAENGLPQPARDAIMALHILFDRDCRVFDRTLELPYDNHDHAFNHLTEAREIDKRAFPLLAASQSKNEGE